jgi:hypothetical protein
MNQSTNNRDLQELLCPAQQQPRSARRCSVKKYVLFQIVQLAGGVQSTSPITALLTSAYPQTKQHSTNNNNTTPTTNTMAAQTSTVSLVVLALLVLASIASAFTISPAARTAAVASRYAAEPLL